MLNRIYLIIGVLLMVGCEGILDKEPIATLDAGSFFQTGADAEQAINAAYQPLLFSNQNNNFYWAMAVVTGDEAIDGGDGSRPGITEMENFAYTPRTEEFNTFWQLQYDGITQCNLVLTELPTVEEIQPELRDRIEGEALFLRSYYYFLLTQVFGGVPHILTILPPDELRIPRTDAATIRRQIIADANRAAELLPIAHGAASVGRATRGAALALAAKSALYERDWETVLAQVNRIKELGVYDLVTDYRDNFNITTQNNVESVWEIQHENLELGVGNFLNQWWASNKIDGYSFAETRPEFVAEFEPEDPRRRFTVASHNEEYFGRVYKRSFSSTEHSPRKYIQADSTVTQKPDGDINYTAVRFAEVLLWEAEALNELGRTAEAQQPLERVRARARAQAEDPTTALPMVMTSNQMEMRAAIRHERCVELGYEMHRFFDLVRWGVAEDILPGFEKGKHEVFPIPQTEIDLNPLLEQNDGY